MNNSTNDIIVFAKNLEKILEEKFKQFRNGELLENALDVEEIEENYTEQSTKVKKMEILILENNLQSIQQIKEVYMLSLESNSNQDRIYASTATLIALSTNKELNLSNLTLEQAYLFCNTMIAIPIKNYGIYEKIIASPAILNLVISKAKNLYDQLEIMEDVLLYCDDHCYSEMDDKTCNSAISDCLKVINMTEIKTNDAENIESKKCR